jgi:hypothetical protein
MLARSDCHFRSASKSCAGCRQPFIIRAGQSEAIVGEDGQLYCYDTMCEQEALADNRVVLKRMATGLFART